MNKTNPFQKFPIFFLSYPYPTSKNFQGTYNFSCGLIFVLFNKGLFITLRSGRCLENISHSTYHKANSNVQIYMN